MLRGIVLGTILLLLALSSLGQVRGATLPSGFSSALQSSESNVSLSINILQNMTQLIQPFSLPQVSGSLLGSNASQVASIFQDALRSKSPSANVRDFSLNVVSTPWSAIVGYQWFNITVNFAVDGTYSSVNGAMLVDMAWRSFAIASNVTLAGTELNKLGSAYLVEAAPTISGLTNNKLVSYTFGYDGVLYSRTAIEGAFVNMAVFNFSSLATPLAQWALTYDAATNSIEWLLKRLPTYGVVITQNILESTPPTRTKYLLTFNFGSAAITAPLRSSISGDAIKVVFGDGQATLMSLIIVATSGIAVGTVLIERRTIASVNVKRRKR